MQPKIATIVYDRAWDSSRNRLGVKESQLVDPAALVSSVKIHRQDKST